MLDLPCCLMSSIQLVLIVLALVFAFICLIIKLISSPYPEIKVFKQEHYFKTSKTGDQTKKFGSLEDPSSVDLSVIIPAYCEEERLPKMLDECIMFLESRPSSYEIVIVDDGSRDTTSEVGLNYVDKYGSDKIRVLTLAQNRGKGGAVRMGMLRGRGEKLLFADADGATTFEDIVKLEKLLGEIESDGQGIACGSRAHLEDDSIAQRTFFRTILMHGFHAVVWVFAVKSISDTQCGFKLLTRKSAVMVFKTLHIERWAFDVEMLKIAEMVGIPTGEVPVRWMEIEGSKLDPILAAIQMFRDIFLLWLKYTIGAWQLSPVKKDD